MLSESNGKSAIEYLFSLPPIGCLHHAVMAKYTMPYIEQVRLTGTYSFHILTAWAGGRGGVGVGGGGTPYATQGHLGYTWEPSGQPGAVGDRLCSVKRVGYPRYPQQDVTGLLESFPRLAGE